MDPGDAGFRATN